MNEPHIKSERLSTRKMVLFSTGDLATSIPLAIVMFFQLYFLTDIAGLRPELAGWAIGIGRVWDAINDPLFGQFSDRIRSRHGRRRVVLLYGAVPLGIAFMLMWLVPDFGQIGLMTFYALTFILFDSMFTFIHVSYNALTPEMTRDYDERSSLNGFRMVFSIGGTLGTIILATVLGWYIEDKRLLFTVLGLLLGVLTMIPPLVVFRITSDISDNPPVDALPTGRAIRETLRNQPFRMVMGLYLFSWTTASIISSVLIYFVNYYFKAPDQANFVILVAEGAAIAFIPLSVWLAKRFDKRLSFIIGTVSWMVILVGIAMLAPNQLGLAFLLAGLSGFGIATAYVIPWSMIPDIIELDEVRTGRRREGSFYAFASFFQKLGTGFALWLIGQVLAMTGYITPDAGAALPTQPASAVNAIRWTIAVAPVILLAISLLFAWKYPIGRAEHRQLRDQLAEGTGG